MVASRGIIPRYCQRHRGGGSSRIAIKLHLGPASLPAQRCVHGLTASAYLRSECREGGIGRPAFVRATRAKQSNLGTALDATWLCDVWTVPFERGVKYWFANLCQHGFWEKVAFKR